MAKDHSKVETLKEKIQKDKMRKLEN
jgi:hypothetical protein